MEKLCALVLALAVSQESLRFVPVFEQEAEASCGLAVVASLLSLYCGKPVDEGNLACELELGLASKVAAPCAGADADLTGANPRTSISASDIIALLKTKGVTARAFRMDLPGLRSALATGFAPAIVHYDRPERHFALALASLYEHGETLWIMGDPARGAEVLSEGQFNDRWSGVAILVDPSVPDARGRARLAADAARLLGRRALLAAMAATGTTPGIARAGNAEPGRTLELR